MTGALGKQREIEGDALGRSRATLLKLWPPDGRLPAEPAFWQCLEDGRSNGLLCLERGKEVKSCPNVAVGSLSDPWSDQFVSTPFHPNLESPAVNRMAGRQTPASPKNEHICSLEGRTGLSRNTWFPWFHGAEG